MSGSKGVPHDFASCPYHDCEWHEEIRELLQEIEHTHSKRLKALIEEDLIEILDALIEEDLIEILEENGMQPPSFSSANFDPNSLESCDKCGCTMRAHSAEGECPPPFGNPKGAYGPGDPGLGDVPSTLKCDESKEEE
jgi:hypothetical protein